MDGSQTHVAEGKAELVNGIMNALSKQKETNISLLIVLASVDF
jgi:hypothetical protein